MGRYAEWAPSRAELASHRVRMALRRPLRPFWRVLRWIEQTPVLVALWERCAGQDYTGWMVRNLREGGTLRVGEVGTVTRYTFRRRRRHYTVAFARGDLLTRLPAPTDVELIPPAHG